MKLKPVLVVEAFALLSACAPTPPENSSGFITELPEEVIAMAAPNQDLRSVILRPEDGCYWYQHVGVVETTLLPLRTKAGNPICTRADSVVS